MNEEDLYIQLFLCEGKRPKKIDVLFVSKMINMYRKVVSNMKL